MEGREVNVSNLLVRLLEWHGTTDQKRNFFGVGLVRQTWFGAKDA